jgi:hypothetical protein
VHLFGSIGGVLGLISGAVLGYTLTTTFAAAMAGYRLAPHWPVGTMVVVPLLSVLSAATAAAIVARQRTRGRRSFSHRQ